MRLIKQITELSDKRCIRLGLQENTVYLQCNSNQGVEIWSMHILTPGSQSRLFRIPFHRIDYAFSTLAIDRNGAPIIFLFLMGQEEKNDDAFFVRIFKLEPNYGSSGDLDTKCAWQNEVYNISPEAVEELFRIPLHNATIGAGFRSNSSKALTIYIYDRAIVQGPIPYWYILLSNEEKAFAFHRHDIPGRDPDREGGQISGSAALATPAIVKRFPVDLDGARRRFLRISEDRRFLVFREEEEGEAWVPYITRDEDSPVKISELCGARGIRETYSASGHRMTAIESMYHLYADQGCCVLRHAQDGIYRFWRLVLEDSSRTFFFVSSGCAHLGQDLSVGRMNYTLINYTKAILIGSNELAIIHLQPPPLIELAFWSLQTRLAERDEVTGALCKGISISHLAKALSYRGSRPLLI